MSDTMQLLAERLREEAMYLVQVRGSVWVLRTKDGVIDLGPTPMTGPEWMRFVRRLREAGANIPRLEGPWAV